MSLLSRLENFFASSREKQLQFYDADHDVRRILESRGLVSCEQLSDELITELKQLTETTHADQRPVLLNLATEQYCVRVGTKFEPHLQDCSCKHCYANKNFNRLRDEHTCLELIHRRLHHPVGPAEIRISA